MENKTAKELQAEVTEGARKRRLEIMVLRREGKTLKEIGAAYGITPERVRQIELAGIRDEKRGAQ